MAFKKLATLETDVAVTIGGVDKKTGKANPKSVEGYFLHTKALGPNKFNKSKTDYMHILQTSKGNVGVWGKTHMDKQLLAVPVGTMIRITANGTKDVGKGNPMTCYLVEVDEDNVITVNFEANTPSESSDGDDYSSTDLAYGEDEEESAVGEDEEAVDEAPPVRAAPPRQAAAAPNAAQQARVKSLLGGKSRST